MSKWALGIAHAFIRKHSLLKFIHLGLLFCLVSMSSREFSSPAVFTHGLAWGTLNPLHDAHTHSHYIYAVLSLSVSFFCRSLCLCFLLSLSLSFFLPLFSVELVNPSSLYRTTSFDTHSKNLSVNCTDRMRPSFPKSCVSVRVYARFSWVNSTSCFCMMMPHKFAH